MESLPLNHQDLRTIIEQAGLRCTPQRLAVYDHLSQSTEHPTAEDVYQAVRSRIPKISLATVYKALEAWVAVGVATKLDRGNRRELREVRCTPRPALPFSLPAIRNRSRLADPFRPRSDHQARPPLA